MKPVKVSSVLFVVDIDETAFKVWNEIKFLLFVVQFYGRLVIILLSLDAHSISSS